MNRPALLAAALVLSAAPLFAAGTAAGPRAMPPAQMRAALPPVPAGTAEIAALSGAPDVLLDGVEPWVRAAVGMQLTPGTQIRTGLGSATLVFFDGSKVRVDKHSEFTLETAQPSSISIFLAMGRFEAWVAKVHSRTFKGRTPTSVAAVRGTVFSMATNGRRTDIDLFRGSLAVNDNFGNSALLGPGQHLQTTLTAPTMPLKPLPLPQGAHAPREPRFAFAPPPPPPPPAGQQPPPPPAGQQPPPPPDTMQAGAPPPPIGTDLSGTQQATPPPSPEQNGSIVPISPSAP